MKKRYLEEMMEGEEGVVTSLEGEDHGILRLRELGLRPGRAVRLLRRARWGGPLDIMIGTETRLSLRREMARQVLLS